MGIYHPTAQGIIDGRIIGIKNSLSMVEYIVKNDVKSIEVPSYYAPPQTEYFIGFGTGYEQGQKIRELLRNDMHDKLSFDEKIACFSYLLDKQKLCNVNLTRSYLENTKYWHITNIPSSTVKKAHMLLDQNKLQRAIEEIFEYYKNNFQLKSLKEFDEIVQKLKDLRQNKRVHKKTNITVRLEQIKKEVREWIRLG